MALPYPIPDPATGIWDPFALKSDLEYLDRFTVGTAHRTLSLQVGPVLTSGTDETTLFTYTLPVNQLSLDGQRLELYASGRTDTGASTKWLRLYFGGTQLMDDATVASAKDFVMFARIIRLSDATQLCVVWDTVDAAVNNAGTTTTTHSMATELAVTLACETSSGSEPVTGNSFELVWIPA